MKLFFYLLAIITLTYSSVVSAQKVSPSGNQISKDINIKPFDHLVIKNNFEVTISQGETESLSLQGDENIMPYLEIKQNNGKLTIGLEDGLTLSNIDPIIVSITLINLKKLEISGINDVKSNSIINIDQLDLQISGKTNLTIDIKVNQLDCDISGISNIDIKGSTNTLNIESSGKSNIRVNDLKAKNVKLESSGISNIDVHASHSLYIESSGLGNIRYKGEPKDTDFDASGLTNISKF